MARIERCRLDGSGRVRIVDADIEQPTALTIDRDQELLYWADTALKVTLTNPFRSSGIRDSSGVFSFKTIRVAHLDGSQRRVLIASQLVQPIALAVHGRHLYWLEKVRIVPKIPQKHRTVLFGKHFAPCQMFKSFSVSGCSSIRST